MQEPFPGPVAPPLPPSPNPSDFTFTGLDASPGSGDVQISFRLFGGSLLPYSSREEAAIRGGLEQTLRGTLGEIFSFSHTHIRLVEGSGCEASWRARNSGRGLVGWSWQAGVDGDFCQLERLCPGVS